MSSDEFNEKMTKILEAISGLIKMERIQNARIEENSKQIAGLIEVARLNTEQIEALVQQGREQGDRIDALIRIVEGQVSNHP